MKSQNPHKTVYSSLDYSLVQFREEDLYTIMKWRNSQMDILRQSSKLTRHDQLSYYKNVIKPSFNEQFPKIMLFSYLHNGTCIGYGGLTNIDWVNRNAEVSFLVSSDIAKNAHLYGNVFSIYLSMIKDIAFSHLDLHRIYTETYEFRTAHIEILEQNDFPLEGVLKEHVIVNNEYIDSSIHGILNE